MTRHRTPPPIAAALIAGASIAALPALTSCGEQEQPPARPDAAQPEPSADVAVLISEGRKVYDANCLVCHQADGGGVPAMQPAIDDSPIATGDTRFLIEHTLRGVGVQNGLESSPQWNVAMPAFHRLDDREIAAVLTYMRQAWSNDASPITSDQVADVRAELRRQELIPADAEG